jgi:hypothetical protein
MNTIFQYYPSSGFDLLIPEPLYSGTFETKEEYDNII